MGQSWDRNLLQLKSPKKGRNFGDLTMSTENCGEISEIDKVKISCKSKFHRAGLDAVPSGMPRHGHFLASRVPDGPKVDFTTVAGG